jgi:plastocyanin
MSDSLLAPILIGFAVGIGLIVVFSVMFNSSNAKVPENHVAIVIIPEGAVLQSSEHHFEPSIIRVKVNDTVRWINQDSVPSSVVADDASRNSAFYNFTHNEDNAATFTHNFLLPNKSFEFTFTETGVYGYHSVPHPWMYGTVIVLDNLP